MPRWASICGSICARSALQAPHASRSPALAQAAAIPSISVASVAAKQAEGYVFVDVRPAEDFEAFHAVGSVSVPLFGPITLDSPSKLMKQLLYSFNGMKGTDENPRFLEDLAQAVPAKSKVLLMCDSGGTYLPLGVTVEGRRSRSLVALYKMLEAGGWADLLHVYGGIREWCACACEAAQRSLLLTSRPVPNQGGERDGDGGEQPRQLAR